MRRLSWGKVRTCHLLFALVSFTATLAWAQFETATVSGQVSDPSGLSVAGARVELVDIDRGASISSTTNNSGLYRFASVHPGHYRMEVRANGFRVVNVTGVTVNVQDHLEQNFQLTVGSAAESVTVEGQAPLIDTETGTVSTVVDRQFAENLPMNGRSFQSLVELTPGVVVTTTSVNDNGQFSVDGQRAASNYWMVDGVGANIGIGLSLYGMAGNGLGGAVGSYNAMGGTNSLVSVDALQEFRIQTSTYAPEFGRTPGAQISISTRSGTNQFHGTLFNYFRNDKLDANDWFADRDGLKKPQERQNDFGGTLGGPLIKNRTFFFISYEGLRLRLPQVGQTTVPDLSARANAIPAMVPYFSVFPLPDPNLPDDPNLGIAHFNASFSDKASLDAGSVRIDHKLNDQISVFGRYDQSPSTVLQRRASSTALNNLNLLDYSTQTVTAGTTWNASPRISNDFRFNYSKAISSGTFYLDNFGGGVPLTSLPFPSSITANNGIFWFESQAGLYIVGNEGKPIQRQINIVDNVSLQKGSHSTKFGVDFRRLSPEQGVANYRQVPFFTDMPSAENGTPLFTVVDSETSPTFLFRNIGAFAQDTWRVVPRLTLTYGLRWDVDFVPHLLKGAGLPAAVGFDLNNLSNLGLAPLGTTPYSTRYNNFAPRIGLAYSLFQSREWQTVLRGGFGLFYDLASSEAGNNVLTSQYPLGSETLNFGSFPLADPSPAPISAPSPTNPGTAFLYDPHLRLPYTWQWNVAIEQSLGPQQSISASYIGSAGKRLLASAYLFGPSPSLSVAQLVMNAGRSDYDALQVQFQRRLSRGLQALASYSWAHSIDTGSAGSIGVVSNTVLPSSIPGTNRGPSDFDIRHAFSAGITYDIPGVRLNKLTDALFTGWSLENEIQVRSAPPVDISYAPSGSFFPNNFYGDIRPDLVSGQPFYLRGAQCASIFQGTGDLASGQGCPGGWGFNPAAFAPPAGLQGTTPRNFLRGFGATQWDFAVHRDFKLTESAKLQFREELFNFLNHPNFGPPSGFFGFGTGFGLPLQTLGQSLGGFGSSGAGGFSSLYQMGGPRSIQLALKLFF